MKTSNQFTIKQSNLNACRLSTVAAIWPMRSEPTQLFIISSEHQGSRNTVLNAGSDYTKGSPGWERN